MWATEAVTPRPALTQALVEDPSPAQPLVPLQPLIMPEYPRAEATTATWVATLAELP